MRSVLILGAGVTGQAIAVYLDKQGIAYRLVADTKKPGDIHWADYDGVIKSPGVPLWDPLIKAAQLHGVSILSDVALFANPNGAKVVGVTGTNGKSTVCAMIDHMLQVAGKAHALGGNFGTPIVDLPVLSADGVYVLELSSYQLELPASAVYDIGVLLNIDEDHRDHHLTMAAYIDAKENVLRAAQQKIVVINDVHTQDIAMRHDGVTLSNLPNNGYWTQNNHVFKGDVLQAVLPIFTGPHDVSNAAVTWIVGKMLQIDEITILDSLRTYQSLPHRQAFVRTIGKIDCINDSKATNVHAVISALTRFSDRPIHLILGGVPKFENLDDLIPHLKNVVRVYGIGQASALIEKSLKGIMPFEPCGDMKTAVATIFTKLDVNSPAIVLLSPACASFDQYENYEARGNDFENFIKS